MDSNFDWHALAHEAQDVILSAHGEFLKKDKAGIVDLTFTELVDLKLACIVFANDDDICFQSRGFQALTGYAQTDLCRKVAWLKSDKDWLDLAVNGPQMNKLQQAHEDFFNQPKGHQRKHFVTMMIGCKSNGEPFWSLRHVFPVLLQGERFVLHILTPVETPIPGLIWPRASHAKELVISNSQLEGILATIHQVVDNWPAGTDVSIDLAGQVAGACEGLEQLLKDALEGDHFVPRLGGNAVSAFNSGVQWAQIYSSVEADLKAVWAVCDQQTYMTDEAGKSVTLACAIADTQAPDCPLVYVSPGFETLTGYSNDFAQGRNCRFLQPNEKSRNIAFNGPELIRMKEFCTEMRHGQMFNLLLNENRNGEPFWNLLFMKHLNLGRGRRYILGLQTNIELQKEILDMMVPREWTVEGLALLAKLREILLGKQDDFSPSERSFVALANDITAKWILEYGRGFDCFWEGDHYCPMVGNAAAKDFVGCWPELAEICLKSVLELNKIQVVVRKGSKTEAQANDTRITELDQVVCAVADPSMTDCPLVYISDSFVEMTGYGVDFALGRNCRFLQPNQKEMNHILNGDECGRMKEFCLDGHPVGHSIMNLLLNERRTGERFWNLLHMTHVERHGKRYILAVQTNLDLPMPLVLKTNKAWHHLDEEKILNSAFQMGNFLTHLRWYLRETSASQDMGRAGAYVIDSVMKFFKESCEDYAGDHYVPALGLDDVEFFDSHVTWPGICSALTGTAHPGIADVPGIAFSVSDVSGTDCPIVYTSRNFNLVVGYKQEYAIGRNARFQRVKVQERDNLVNGDELKRLEEFIASHSEGAGEFQMVAFFLHENNERDQLWSVNVYQVVELARRKYLITTHGKLDMGDRPDMRFKFVELLAMDSTALEETQRMRHLLCQRFTCLDWETFPIIGEESFPAGEKHYHRSYWQQCMEIWARRFSPCMEVPWVPVCDAAVPCIALEIGSNCGTDDLIDQLASALSIGFRHLHFAFRGNLSMKDERLCEMEGQLFALRVAQVFSWLKKHHYLYVQENLVCSIRTPPFLATAFHELYDALKSARQPISYWLLDVSCYTGSKHYISQTVKCWQNMLGAREAGNVKELGLYGISEKTEQVVNIIRKMHGAPIRLCATEMYPGKQIEHRFARSLQELAESGVKMFAYNCFGRHMELLQAPDVVMKSAALGIDPKVLILKSLLVHGWMCLTSQFIQPPGEGLGDRHANQVTWLSHVHVRKDDSTPTDSLTIEPIPVFPKFGREFTAQFSKPGKAVVHNLWTFMFGRVDGALAALGRLATVAAREFSPNHFGEDDVESRRECASPESPAYRTSNRTSVIHRASLAFKRPLNLKKQSAEPDMTKAAERRDAFMKESTLHSASEDRKTDPPELPSARQGSLASLEGKASLESSQGTTRVNSLADTVPSTPEIIKSGPSTARSSRHGSPCRSGSSTQQDLALENCKASASVETGRNRSSSMIRMQQAVTKLISQGKPSRPNQPSRGPLSPRRVSSRGSSKNSMWRRNSSDGTAGASMENQRSFSKSSTVERAPATLSRQLRRPSLEGTHDMPAVVPRQNKICQMLRRHSFDGTEEAVEARPSFVEKFRGLRASDVDSQATASGPSQSNCFPRSESRVTNHSASDADSLSLEHGKCHEHIAARRAELEALSMKEVKKRAREAGLTEADIEEAEEEERPKPALISMIVNKAQESEHLALGSGTQEGKVDSLEHEPVRRREEPFGEGQHDAPKSSRRRKSSPDALDSLLKDKVPTVPPAIKPSYIRRMGR